MAGIVNVLWYIFVIWLCGVFPILGIPLLGISLYKDLKE